MRVSKMMRALTVIAMISILTVVTGNRFALAEQKSESSEDSLEGSGIVTIKEGPGTRLAKLV